MLPSGAFNNHNRFLTIIFLARVVLGRVIEGAWYMKMMFFMGLASMDTLLFVILLRFV